MHLSTLFEERDGDIQRRTRSSSSCLRATVPGSHKGTGLGVLYPSRNESVLVMCGTGFSCPDTLHPDTPTIGRQARDLVGLQPQGPPITEADRTD
jgi:hypothetical protein